MIKNISLCIALISATLFAENSQSEASECSYKKVFGFAKITKIEDNNASISFTIEESSGKRRVYKEPFIIIAPLGIKAKETYPAILNIRQSGSCEKHKIMIIQEIGAACRVK